MFIFCSSVFFFSPYVCFVVFFVYHVLRSLLFYHYVCIPTFDFFFLFLFCSVRSNEIPAEVVNLLVFLEDFLIYSQLPRKVCWILFFI